MTKLLTAGEIATRIQEPGEDLRTIGERLRSWTKEGILKPSGKRNPGTGRHLQYPERVVIDAAILSKLAKHFGIWAPRMQHCDSALDLAAKEVNVFEETLKKDGKLIYLTIGVLYKDKNSRIPSEIFSEIQRVDILKSKKNAAPNRRLPDNHPWREHRHIGVPELLEFGIVINLTSLLQRLGFSTEVLDASEDFYSMFPEARRLNQSSKGR